MVQINYIKRTLLNEGGKNLSFMLKFSNWGDPQNRSLKQTPTKICSKLVLVYIKYFVIDLKNVLITNFKNILHVRTFERIKQTSAKLND